MASIADASRQHAVLQDSLAWLCWGSSAAQGLQSLGMGFALWFDDVCWLYLCACICVLAS
jgi:hypothetical protein